MPESDEYGLLRRTSDDTLELVDAERRMGRLDDIPVSLRPARKNNRAMLVVSFILFGFSLVLTIQRHLGPPPPAGIHRSPTLSKLWPVGLPNHTDLWENENSKSLHALVTCLGSDSCSENQKSIVLLGSFRFWVAIRGGVTGEEIWALSVLHALRQMGYTTVFTDTNEQLAAAYRQFPDLVKVVLVEGADSEYCFRDPHCIKTKDHLLGVPAWKMLSFHFWPEDRNPLGNGWTLAPENYPILTPGVGASENVYIGYSIEETCEETPYVPFSERPRQAYMLAKKLDYFGWGYSWPNIEFDKPPFDISFLAGIREGSQINTTLPGGINDLGLVNKTQFLRHVSESRIMLGIGSPKISPSPYDAFCMGVPFLNPVEVFDPANPEDRTKWRTQHDGVKYQDPPYVYNVKVRDEKGFWDALRAAMETPIERYILPNMTMEALKVRVRNIVEDDWRGKAEHLLEVRRTTEKGELFEM